ncbi:hypothetical protein XHC_3683 [Xanthomonas hortorum pv. carotae str. M081]|nr:hypothetical protein XHC_3683 [Xanthomonas hortorum pv. carotae str. M081]
MHMRLPLRLNNQSVETSAAQALVQPVASQTSETSREKRANAMPVRWCDAPCRGSGALL